MPKNKPKSKFKIDPTMNERSTKLRHTKEIADYCGFKYPITRHNAYGGVFTIVQLEIIINTLKKQKWSSNDE